MDYVFNDRYTDDKYGLEQKSSYKYFRLYLKEPKPRNLKEFHRKLSVNLSENGKKKIPTFKTIYDYSHKWKWNKRADAYDQYIQNSEDEELKQLFRDIKKVSLRKSQERIDYQNQLLEDIKNDNSITVKDKIYSSARNSEAYYNEIKSVNEVYNEGKDIQEIEAELQTNNSFDVSPKSVFEELEELDRELESVYEDRISEQSQDKQ